MTHLRGISIHDVTPELLSWLDKAVKSSYDGESLEVLLVNIRDDYIKLWTIEDAPKIIGIVGLRSIKREWGKELWIDLLAGEGVLSKAAEVHLLLQDLARATGHKRLAGYATRPGLARLYKNGFGLKPAATVFTEEVE